MFGLFKLFPEVDAFVFIYVSKFVKLAVTARGLPNLRHLRATPASTSQNDGGGVGMGLTHA